MLQHGEADCNEESGRKSTCSSKTTIGIVGRFLLTAQIQCLSGLIEYITVTSRRDSYEFVYPVEVLPNCIFDRLNLIPEDWPTVIETLLLDTASGRKRGNCLPVTALERWVLQPAYISSTQSITASVEQACDEIKRFCVTSPLVHWLKNHRIDRARYKLTHRICTTREASSRLGLSFLMDQSELADVVAWHGSESNPYTSISPVALKQAHKTSSTTPLTCQNPSYIIPNQTVRSESDLANVQIKNTIIPSKITTHYDDPNNTNTTQFTPIHLDTGRTLHVSVTSSQNLLSTGIHSISTPFCTVCGTRSKPDLIVAAGMRRPADTAFSASASTSSASSSSSLCTSSASLSSQSDGPPEATHEDVPADTDSWLGQNPAGGRPTSFLGLPWGASKDYGCTETVRSPMVVMTNVKDSFFSGDGWNNPVSASAEDASYEHMLPLGQEFDVSGSGNSTLTKKSRLVTSGDSGGSSNKTKAITTRTKSPPPPVPPTLALESMEQPLLESPPRKQQRMAIVDPTRHGTMDKVIDKFTLLNVQRKENSSSRIPTPLDSADLTAPAADDSVSSPHAVPSPSTRSLSQSPTPKSGVDSIPVIGHLDEDLLVAQDVSTSRSAATDSGLRSSRRRNASSICVSAWPSWSRDSTPFFNRRTGLPLQSSPVPLKRSISGKFDFDASLCPLKLSKSSICMTFGADSRTEPSPVSPLIVSNGATQAPKTGSNPDPKEQVGLSAALSSTVNVSTSSSKSTTNSNQPRRRPASLRLNTLPAPQLPSEAHSASSSFLSKPLLSNSSATVGSNDPSPFGRRSIGPDSHFTRHHHHHPRRNHNQSNTHPNHQSEMSCSAPPSGNRSFSLFSDRLANAILAGTPGSHSSSQHLLVNFEESMLNGRIHPVGQVDGFMLELGASGSFVPDHTRLPMRAYFFDLSDDNTPSPYLGYADLSHLRHGKGYHVPKKGSVQLTLFNPNKFVVKMFVIGYDFEDMPPNSQTFLRQRTVYMPIDRPTTNGDSCKTENLLTGIVHTPQISETVEQQHLVRENKTYGSQLVPPPALGVPSQTSINRRSVPDLFWANRAHAGDTSIADLPNATRNTLTGSDLCSHLAESSSTECTFDLSSSCSCSTASSTCSLVSGSHEQHTHQIGSSSSNCTANRGPQPQPAFLRYLVHLRFHTTRSGRLYLHTDLRLIFARDKFEFDPRVATYELRSFVHAPSNPRYSPKK